MKLLHLGDLHLGKSLGNFDLIEDQGNMLTQMISLVKEEQIDGVLLAGDIYDKAIPSEAAMSLLDSFLASLADLQVSVFMISGNHDSDERLRYGQRFFENCGIHIASRFEGTLSSYSLADNYGEVCIYMLPFVKASQVKRFYPEEEILTYDDAVRVLIEHTKIDTSKRNILVAHQFVTGEHSDPIIAGSEGLGTQSVGLVEKISVKHFDDFDYVALGHIHSGQAVGRETVRYAGSFLKYSLSEAYHNKTVPIITLEEKGVIDVSLHPVKPKRDLRHIKGELKVLLQKDYIQDTDDFIYATLTDEELVNDAMSIFQQYYPYTVKIDYDNSRTRQLEQVEVLQMTEDKSFQELVGDFYQLMYQCDISEEELELLEMVARQAGVLHETD